MDSRSSGRWPWVIAGGVIFLFALLSSDFWSMFVILGGAELVVYALIRVSRDKQAQDNQARSRPLHGPPRPEPTLAELTGSTSDIRSRPRVNSARAEEPAVAAAASHANRSQSGGADECYAIGSSSGSTTPNYALPKAPKGLGLGRWVPPGEPVRIAGAILPEGMVYVGTRLNAPNGGTAPCLINGSLPVAGAGDYRTREMGYWPSYTKASPSERRAYLTWLSEGRSDPDCDIGYVFLFFYGLERRIIVDSSGDDAAKGDWSAIVRELRRLLEIYGEKSGSFRHYAGELLSWIELDGTPRGLYAKPVPDFPRSYELPPYVRLALGQASIDGAPIPAPLALAWVRLAPDYRLRTAATRCPEEFERLFTARYHDDLGSGLVLPINRTKLRFVYRAASAGLVTAAERRRLHAHLQLLVADPPTLTGLKKKLQALSMAARESIAGFMVTLAQSDGFVSPDEVKLLEKIYKVLGIEANRVFSDVHAAGAGGGRTPAAKTPESGVHLDADRIAVLQQDDARVSAMLALVLQHHLHRSLPYLR